MFIRFVLFCFCFVPSLSSCHEKATVALYFARIRTCLRSCPFPCFLLFLWLLTAEFAACSKPPSRDNHRRAPYPRTQQPNTSWFYTNFNWQNSNWSSWSALSAKKEKYNHRQNFFCISRVRLFSSSSQVCFSKMAEKLSNGGTTH